MAKLKPVFVKNSNTRAFDDLMDGLDLAAGEGCLGLVHGRAGRGKTRTTQRWHAHHPSSIYLRALTVWHSSELEFLKALCRELRIDPAPGRKGPAFMACVNALIEDPVPVFIDEIEKLSRRFLDVIRDLTDLTAAPFILIGEDELVPHMKRNRRVWSRTFQHLEFKPVGAADVASYAHESADLTLSKEVVYILHGAADGDFRLVRRNLLNLIHQMERSGQDRPTEEMARIAVRAGLTGR